jgi:hypothetical protein
MSTARLNIKWLTQSFTETHINPIGVKINGNVVVYLNIGDVHTQRIPAGICEVVFFGENNYVVKKIPVRTAIPTFTVRSGDEVFVDVRVKTANFVSEIIIDKFRHIRNNFIFISYKTVDTQQIVYTIKSELAREYGEQNVQMDVDFIKGGQKIRTEIKQAIANCDLLIPIIGGNWLDVTPDVQAEIELALNYNKAILPILWDGAKMPKPNQLPASIREITEILGMPLRSGSEFRSGIRNIVDAVERIFRKQK